jgi:phosphohistidine phosphatase
MKLMFLRHGIAEDRSADGSDHSRRLTPEGKDLMRLEATGMVRAGIKPALILTSPLVRAVQTAEIVAEVLDMDDRLRQEARLGPGFTLEHLRTITVAHSDRRALMLVGHEPTLSVVVGQLIGGANVRMKKGSLAIVDVEEVEHGAGCLQALLPPSALAAASGDD